MVSLRILLALGTALVAPAASALHARQSNSSTSCSPTATVKNGTYAGIRSSQWGQDFFLGIPFAKPPPRFEIASHLDTTWTGKRAARAYPKHCVGYGGDNVGYEMSEDCLYLNVVRPSGTHKADALPVAVWIHGGGLFNGGSADVRYNLSFIVQNGVEQGTPFIGVSINYRVHAFGFLFGKEATEGGATNLGFRDQRLALQWVQENIAAFGGSPEKVTIWGESAGAESISAQVLAYNGRDDKLFRAIAAQSGFAGFDSQRYQGGLNATDAHQRMYNNLVTNTSCAPTVGTPASLACLKKVPLEELHKALNGTTITPYAPVLDGDFIASYPSVQFAAGNYVKAAALIGCNTDEGAGTSSRRPQGANTEAEVRVAAARILGPKAPEMTGKSVDDLVDELMYLYPDIQAVGLPGFYRIPVLLPGDTLANVTGLQLRRTAALWGDLWMHYKRRRASVALSRDGVRSYSYRFDVLVNGPAAQAGSGHFQEVAFVFDNTNAYGYATNPFANKPESFKALAKTMSRAWVNFFVSMDPNGGGDVGGVTWPEYDIKAGGGVGRGIVFDESKNYVEMDSWRAEGINWYIKNALAVFGD